MITEADYLVAKLKGELKMGMWCIERKYMGLTQTFDPPQWFPDQPIGAKLECEPFSEWKLRMEKKYDNKR